MIRAPLTCLAVVGVVAFSGCSGSGDASEVLDAGPSNVSDAGTASAFDAARGDAATSTTTDAGTPPASSDGGAASVSDTGTCCAATLHAVGRDEDFGTGPITRGARLQIDWDLPGATQASLAGAGDMIALEEVGAPSFDDMTGGTATLATAIATAQLPFEVTLLGDRWPALGRIAISPKGVISRGLQTATSILDAVLPVPKRSGVGPADWADGTIAPFLDGRFEGRDSSARITTKAFDAGLPTERFVVEWTNFTTGIDFKPRLAASLRVQAALFANGSVTFRYGPATNPSTSTPVGDGAFLRGQGASIGLASSTGKVVAAGQHTETLASTGTTLRFLLANSLPPSGRATFIVPSTAGSTLPLTVLGSNGASASTNVAVVDAYKPAVTSSEAFTSIRTASGVRSFTFGSESVVPLELPFPVQVFGERWQSLAVFRTASVGPWGASVLGMTGGTNYDAAPFAKPVSPSGFVAGLYQANGSSWCAASGTPTAYALVRDAAPIPSVTVEWPALQKCGSSTLGSVDVQVTLRANGDVQVHHGNVSSSSATVTDQTLYVGAENGSGTIARMLSLPSAALPASRLFTFVRGNRP